MSVLAQDEPPPHGNFAATRSVVVQLLRWLDVSWLFRTQAHKDDQIPFDDA